MRRTFLITFDADDIPTRELINDLHIALGAYCTSILRKIQIKEISAGGVLNDKLFPCDPDRNKKCSKESCFINGGDCFQTTHEEYKWREND